MIRLFVAITTPHAILPSLTSARDLLRKSRAEVKWEPAKNLHCTVKFLGDTREDLVAPISEALAAIGNLTPQFGLLFRDLGCFPGRHDPRIIWAGVENSDGGLKRLFEAVDHTMSGLGFAREPRAFHPHVTLGRVKGPRRMPELLETMETITLLTPLVTIQEMELVKSTPQPGGSVYSSMARVMFGGRDAGGKDQLPR
jgi:2'-5' RNA ligase